MENTETTTQVDEHTKQTVEAGIARPYAYHKPSETGLEKITRIRKAFSDLDALIKEVCPGSRERATAITNLETTAMWAIKSIVLNEPKPKAVEPEPEQPLQAA